MSRNLITARRFEFNRKVLDMVVTDARLLALRTPYGQPLDFSTDGWFQLGSILQRTLPDKRVLLVTGNSSKGWRWCCYGADGAWEEGSTQIASQLEAIGRANWWADPRQTSKLTVTVPPAPTGPAVVAENVAQNQMQVITAPAYRAAMRELWAAPGDSRQAFVVECAGEAIAWSSWRVVVPLVGDTDVVRSRDVAVEQAKAFVNQAGLGTSFSADLRLINELGRTAEAARQAREQANG